MVSKKALNTLLASAVVLTVAGAGIAANAQDAPEKEKCYGVVKAGKNDCAAAGGAHSCAGHSSVDGGSDEWVALPTGVCEKLVGGSLMPASGGGAPAEKPSEGESH